MKILYITQYFSPELGATQTRAREHVLNLLQMGHEVTILTEMPNHPKGVIWPEYRSKLFVRERWQGLRIVRVWVFTRPQKNFLTRILFYLSFMIAAVLAGILFLREKYDIVYATSPPFFVGIVGIFLSLWTRGKFIFEVRDIWPQSAVALGELRKPCLIAWSERLEEFYYRRADRVVAVTKGIAENLAKRIGREKVVLIPNGANTELFHRKDTDLRQVALFKDKFVVIYTGVIGLIHDVETIVRAAKLLERWPDILFLIIGDGVRKSYVQSLAKQLQLRNIHFMEAVPEEELVSYLAIAQVGLATAKRLELCRGTLPVKMFSAMACSLPVVLAVDGEAHQLLEQADAGIHVEPETPQQMAEAILFLYRNHREARRLGENGRAFVMAHYSRKQLTRKLERCLWEVLNLEVHS